MAGTSDYFLTHLDAAGIDYTDTHPRDGISLVQCIEGTATARSGTIAFQSHGTSAVMSQDFKAMKVRTGASSANFTTGEGYPLDQWMLFDMTLTNQYLIERANVASNHPAVVASMTADYDAWNLSCSNSFHGADYDTPFSASGDYKGLAGNE